VAKVADRRYIHCVELRCCDQHNNLLYRDRKYKGVYEFNEEMNQEDAGDLSMENRK
jgi:hypothetical protein